MYIYFVIPVLYTQVSYQYAFLTYTSRTNLETLICEYGDETFDTFNVTQNINNQIYKSSTGFLPLDLSNHENLNLQQNIQSNRYILTNTEFENDILIKSIEILPSKIGFINLGVISYQFQCNVSCNYQLQLLNPKILSKKYKLSTNMTLELKNLSLHTFYFNIETPLEAG